MRAVLSARTGKALDQPQADGISRAVEHNRDPVCCHMGGLRRRGCSGEENIDSLLQEFSRRLGLELRYRLE